MCDLAKRYNEIVDAANAGETIDLAALAVIGNESEKVYESISEIASYWDAYLFENIFDSVQLMLRDFKPKLCVNPKEYSKISYKESVNDFAICILGKQLNEIIDNAIKGEVLDLEALRQIEQDAHEVLSDLDHPQDIMLAAEIGNLAGIILKDLKISKTPVKEILQTQAVIDSMQKTDAIVTPVQVASKQYSCIEYTNQNDLGVFELGKEIEFIVQAANKNEPIDLDRLAAIAEEAVAVVGDLDDRSDILVAQQIRNLANIMLQDLKTRQAQAIASKQSSPWELNQEEINDIKFISEEFSNILLGRSNTVLNFLIPASIAMAKGRPDKFRFTGIHEVGQTFYSNQMSNGYEFLKYYIKKSDQLYEMAARMKRGDSGHMYIYNRYIRRFNAGKKILLHGIEITEDSLYFTKGNQKIPRTREVVIKYGKILEKILLKFKHNLELSNP